MSFVTLAALYPCLARAQEPAAASQTPTACRASSCGFDFDWGNGQGASSIPIDRRYGGASDFEAAFRARLAEKGFRVVELNQNPGTTGMVRLTMAKRVLCDRMPGTSSDRSCQTVQDAAVSYVMTDTSIKKLGSSRVVNRCGDPSTLMTMAQFGRYLADVIAYTIEGEQTKAPKPVAKCT